MAPPSNEVIQKRFKDMNPTQEIVETVSFWVLHNRAHVELLARGWIEAFDALRALCLVPCGEFSTALAAGDNANKRLAMIYLVNDVCQKAKHKQHDTFISAFVPPLLHAIDECR